MGGLYGEWGERVGAEYYVFLRPSQSLCLSSRAALCAISLIARLLGAARDETERACGWRPTILWGLRAGSRGAAHALAACRAPR